MNLLGLRYFIEVANEKNITKAAEKLYISQQSLSGQIMRLEKEMGVKLFDRAPDFALTYAGSRFLDYAEKTLSLNRELVQEINDIKSNARGELRLGISHTRGRAVLPVILPEFCREHPQMEIKLTETHSDDLSRLLQEGKIDIMIGFGPVVLPGTRSIPLVRDKLLLAVPKKITDAVYGKNADQVRQSAKKADVAAFSSFPFILLTKQNRLRDILDIYCEKRKIKLNITLETENSETALCLAMEGMGITVYPEMFLPTSTVMKDKAESTLDLFPFPDEHNSGELVLAYSESRYISKPVSDFVSLARKKIAEIM